MKRLVGSVVFGFFCLTSAFSQDGAPKTVVVHRPTVLAFFPPVTDAELERDPGTNEALGDFQLYAMRAGPRLKKAGIDFEVFNAVKFKIKSGPVIRTFKAGGIGYYFITPGKAPLVRFGVMTDDDIIAVAAEYFGTKAPL
jgi:hypothetical protein